MCFSPRMNQSNNTKQNMFFNLRRWRFHSAPSLPMIARKNMSAQNLWHTGTLTFGIVLNRILCVVLLLMFVFVDSQQKIDLSIPRKVFLTLCHHCAMPCVGRQKSNIRLSICCICSKKCLAGSWGSNPLQDRIRNCIFSPKQLRDWAVVVKLLSFHCSKRVVLCLGRNAECPGTAWADAFETTTSRGEYSAPALIKEPFASARHQHVSYARAAAWLVE